MTNARILLLAVLAMTIAFGGRGMMPEADAALVSANVTIGDIPPNVTSLISCCFKDSDASSYNLTNCRDEGSSEEYLPSGGKPYDMMCNFTVSDYNGYQDMSRGWVNITWFRSNVTWNSPQSNDTLYYNSSCKNISSTGEDVSISYECGIYNIKYWADAGNWSILVNLSDGQLPGQPHIGNIQIGNMKSIWQSSTIPFGQMNMGENGSEGHLNRVFIQSVTNNTGNTMINLQVSGGSDYMNCTIGAIPTGYINYDVQQDQQMSSACGILSSSPSWGCTAFQLPDCSGTCPNLASLKSTYWGIRIPTIGVGGICSRVITVIAT